MEIHKHSCKKKFKEGKDRGVIGDLHNPKAMADVISAFHKRFKTKTCMAPYQDHEGSIVAAHTLSVQSMLRKIAEDGHVYAIEPAKNLGKGGFPSVINRRGLRDVSVFNGFCQKHDRELFSCLENEQFRFTRKQCFMLAYRAACREYYLKGKHFESIPSPEQYELIHGEKPFPGFEGLAGSWMLAVLSGLKDAAELKDSLDTFLRAEAWDRLVTHAIIFPSTPTVLGTAAFQPFYDLNGNKLQDLSDFEAEMSNLCFSLIPLDVGGAAIFSWLDSSNAAPCRFYESVLSQADLTAAVMHVIFDNTENLAINPAWYERLSDEERQYLLARVMLLEAGHDYEIRQKNGEALRSLGSWGTAQHTSF